MIMKKILMMVKVLLGCLVTACGSSTVAFTQPKDYQVKIVNHSGIELDDVEARMGKHVVSVGILPHGIDKTHGDFNHPILKEATVSFIKGEFDPDKKQPIHTRKTLIKLPEKGFKTIVYTINKDFQIDVSFE